MHVNNSDVQSEDRKAQKLHVSSFAFQVLRGQRKIVKI
jgi:hypothetical protein